MLSKNYKKFLLFFLWTQASWVQAEVVTIVRSGSGAATATLNVSTTNLTTSGVGGSPYSITPGSGLSNTQLVDLTTLDLFVIQSGNATSINLTSNSSVTIAVPILVQSASTLTLKPVEANTYSSALSALGAALVEINPASGADMVIFSGNNANSFSPTSTLRVTKGTLKLDGNMGGGGTLEVGSAGTLIVNSGLSTDSLANAGAVRFNSSAGITKTVATNIANNSTAGTVVINESPSYTGTIELSGLTTYTGATTVSYGTLKLSGPTPLSGNIAIAGTLNLANAMDTTYTGVFSGAGTLAHSSPNTTVLSGTPTFTGGVNVSAGTLHLGDNWTAAKPGLPITCSNGSTIALSCSTGDVNAPFAYTGNITGWSNFVKKGAGTMHLTGASLQLSDITVENGALVLGSSNAPNANIVVNSGSSLVMRLNTPGVFALMSTISGEGGFTVNTGTCSLSIITPQTYTGATTLSGGAVYLDVANAFSSSTNLTLNNTNGAALSLRNQTNNANFSCTIGSLSGSGPLNLGTSSSPATLTLGDSGDHTYSGTISGQGYLVKQGSGTWTVSGNNAGAIAGTTINAGKISVGHINALGSGPVTLAGGQLELNGFTIANTVTVQSGTLNNATATPLVIATPVVMTGATVLNASSGNVTLNSTISGAHDLSLTGGFGKAIATAGLQVNGDITVSTAAASHSGTVVAYGGRSYTMASGATSSVTGALSLAGSSYNVNGGSMTLSGASLTIDPSQVGSSSTLSTTSGGSLILSGTVSSSSAFGKTLEVSLPVTGSGNVTKTDFGTLKYSGSTMHAGSTTVSAGRLILASATAASGSEPVAMTSFSNLEIEGSSLNVARNISGDGHFTKSSSGALIMSGAMTYTGDTLVTDGSLTFSGSVTVSPRAKIEVSADKALTYQGALIPTGAHFNPILGANATLTFDGASLSTSSLEGNDLAIGSSSYTLTLGGQGLSINADRPVTLYAPLTGSGPLVKLGASTLLLDNIGSNANYTGPITVSAGKLLLNANYQENSAITVGASGTVVLEIPTGSTLALSSKTFTGVSGATLAKRGGGTLRCDNSTPLGSYQGTLNIEEGFMQLRNAGLHSSCTANVRSGASLDIVSAGGSATSYTIGSLTLDPRARLRILRENPAALNTPVFNQTVITSLSGSNGSLLVLQFDPAVDNSATPADCSAAPLKVTNLTTSNTNADRIWLRVCPTTNAALTPGYKYSLLQVNGGTSAQDMTSRLRMLPSIMYDPSYTLAGTAGSTSVTEYGNLFYDNDGLYMTVSHTGFYAAAISGGPATAIPSNAFLQTFLSSLQILPHSGLDLFLTSLSLNPSQIGGTLSPMSQANVGIALSSSGFHISNVLSTMLRASDYEHTRLQALPSSGSHLSAHHNLRTGERYSQKGSGSQWSYAFEQSGFSSDRTHRHAISGQSTGFSLALSSAHLLSYQFSQLTQDIKAVSQNYQGSSSSHLSQLAMSSQIDSLSLRTELAAAQHALIHQRHLDFHIHEYSDRWTAISHHNAWEAQGQQQVLKNFPVTSALTLQAGSSYKAQWTAHEGYSENGAEDLSLHVQPWRSLSHQVQPTLGLRYHQGSVDSWVALQAHIGYQHPLTTSGSLEFSMGDYPGVHSVTMPPSHVACYRTSLEASCQILPGLSLTASSQMAINTQTLLADHQSQLSLIWEF